MKTKSKKRKKVGVVSEAKGKTADYIFWLAITCILGGIYVYFVSKGLLAMDSIILLVTGVLLFFTARSLREGRVLTIYLGSFAIVVTIIYILVTKPEYILLSLIYPAMFYMKVFQLLKNDELH